MHSIEKARYASKVRHSDKKYRKKIYINKKSCTAMFLSAALLLTSVNCMQVQAEEFSEQVPPVSAEGEMKIGDTVSGNTLPEEAGMEEPDYVRTESGAIIITAFEPLTEKESRLVLDETEEKLSQEEVIKRLPTALKANANVYVLAESGQPGSGEGEAQQPGTGTEESGQPGSGEGEAQQPGTGTEESGQPGDDTGEEEQPGAGTEEGGQPGGNTGEMQQPGTGTEESGQPGSGEGEAQQPGTGTEDSGQPGDGEGEAQPPTEGETPETDTEREQSVTEQEQSGAEESQAETGTAESGMDDVAVVTSNKMYAAKGKDHQWRFLVAAETEAEGSGVKEAEVNVSESTGGSDNAGNGENDGGADQSGNPDGDMGNSEAGGTEESGSDNGNAGDGENSGGMDQSGNLGGDISSSEAGSANDGGNADSNGDSIENGSGGTVTEDGTTGGGTSTGDDTVGGGAVAEDSTGADADETTLPTEKVEVEIPVQWVCADDYENTELTEHTFRPTWDEAAWFYEAGADADSVPTITVSYSGEIIAEEVSTEEELSAAFAAGLKKIALKADIALTETLRLPASADIELDGQGHSLLRGTDENDLFIGTMISLDGEGYTEETYGTLTLKDIVVNGETTADRAGAPVILDCGSLILEEEAVVRDNDNYGTYPSDEETEVERILDYGGGIQVQKYGQLTVTEESLVTENFADEFGGGVYLADGATLYLHADVVRENSVSDDAGHGADLYAASGSTVYYDSSVDMERDGFYLCDGVILICMQDPNAERAAGRADRDDKNVEIYISASDGSGYDDPFLERLKDKLEGEYGYTVIPKSVQVSTTDLRDWYVYDHYDTEAWEQDDKIEGSTAQEKWNKIYTDTTKRAYYPYTERSGLYHPNPVGGLVYTIADWLDNEGYKHRSINNAYELAQFKEHIANQGTNMTFVGYGSPAFIDFMFYQPQLADEKVVDFEVDSSRVSSHALSGTGFLMNAGVQNGKLYGYLIYYHFGHNMGTMGDEPTYRYVCKLNGVNVANFHGGRIDLKSFFGLGAYGIKESVPEITEEKKASLKNSHNIEVIDSSPVSSEKWADQMSIRIQASDKEIRIWQQPKGAETDIGAAEPDRVPVEDLGYSGFGPLAAYTSVGHSCPMASCFTFSNISMRYTQVVQGGGNLLRPLEFADYTQKGTQKYFLNLFGTDKDKGYNTTGVETELYQAYLRLMQQEGVALITDRKTPFEEYFGKSGEAGSNLFEISQEAPAAPLSVDELAKTIAAYIKKQTTTYIQDIVSPDGYGTDTLKEAQPSQSVGNIWLASVKDGGQIREPLSEETVGEGYKIRIRDDRDDGDCDIDYFFKEEDRAAVTYKVQKPNGDSVSVSDSFVVGKDVSEWLSGRYTVMQTIGSYEEKSAVHGYAYFDLQRQQPSHKHEWDGWSMGEARHWHKCKSCGAVFDSENHIWSGYAEKEPDCTTDGSRTRTCTVCGRTETEIIPAGHRPKEEWGKDDAGHWHECTVCGEKFDAANHAWDEYSDDQVEKEPGCTTEGSWIKTCTVCGMTAKETIPAKGHSFKEEWDRDDAGHWHECEVCGEKFEAASHEWSDYSDDKVEKEPDCTTEGSWIKTCTVCEQTEKVNIPPKGHSPKEEWSVNLLEHWHECEACGAKLEEGAGFHRFGAWVTDEEATEDKDGSRHRACIDCGYTERDPIVRGKITKREDCGEGAPQTVIATALPALALVTLAEEDVHAVGNGTDIEIVLNVEDADNTVSAADKEAVASAVKSYKVGQYFDMTLYKEMNDGRSQVTETGGEIRLAIEVPGKFRNTNRKYAVVRVHNGNAVMLLDLDSEDNTVTIETNRFSTYAFVYADPKRETQDGSKPDREEEKPYPGQEETSVTVNYQAPKEAAIESPGEAVPESQRDSEPKTGQKTHFELYATVAFIQGASYLFFLFGDRRGMTEETKAELVSRLVRWAKKGGKLRRLLALAAIFVLLVYYHSIGKQAGVKWRQVCGG